MPAAASAAIDNVPISSASLMALCYVETTCEHGAVIALDGCRIERALRGEAPAEAFSRALERKSRYEALPLDAFEAGVDAIFRFIQDNPDDLDFVTSSFSAPAEFPSFEPMALEDWVKAHRASFA